MEAAIETDRTEPLLNEEQRRISEEVLNSVEEASLIAENNLIPGHTRMYFVDAPGGTGKTFLFNQIRNRTVAHGYKIKTAAWTGIAATLSKLGWTIHSTFKVPVSCSDGSSCSIAPNSQVGQEMKGIGLFILDEASMISQPVLKAIDRCLRDLTGLDNIPFGCKTFVLGGDFWQTLPIVPRSHNLGVANYCVKSSDLWNVCQQHHLQQNMRLLPRQDQFNNFLMQLGSNRLPTKLEQPFQGCIEIPTALIEQGSLVDSVSPDGLPEDEMASRIILTSCNDTSLTINKEILERQVGDVTTYFAADHAKVPDNPDEANNYPLEFLHSLTPSEMPPHTLKLKVGCIAMLLRSLDPSNDLCNGTQLFVWYLIQVIWHSSQKSP